MIIFLTLVTYTVLAFKNIYIDYIMTKHSIIINHFNPMLHHNFDTDTKSYCINNSINKTNKFIEVNRE